MSELLHYANFYILPMVCLILVYLSVRNSLFHFAGKHCFSVIILIINIGCIGELISKMPWEWSITHHIAVLGATMSNFSLVAATYVWFLYVCCRIRQVDRVNFVKGAIGRLTIPLACYHAIVLTSAWNHLIFYIDPVDGYHPGPLRFLPYVVSGFYVLVSTIYVIIARKEAILEDRKREFQSLAMFMMFVIIGVVIQTFAIELPAVVLCGSFSLIMVYFRTLNVLSNLDDLTGLNNSSQFYQYLEFKFENTLNNQWALVIIDLDEFKLINDTYGHVIGDRALCHMAEILRDTFKDKGTFISRCGGDEFAVITEYKNAIYLDYLIDKLQINVDAYNESGGMFQLAYSLGFVCFDSDIKTSEEMLSIADEKMYAEKYDHKKGKVEDAICISN